MKRYKLLKDLPTFKAGDKFELRGDGCLWQYTRHSDECHWERDVMAYHKKTLEHFPNILEDWFEEIKEPEKALKMVIVLDVTHSRFLDDFREAIKKENYAYISTLVDIYNADDIRIIEEITK